MVELKIKDIENKQSKILFESFLLYLAFWSGHSDLKKEEWTLRELYGEAGEKYFITSAKKGSLTSNTKNRIDLLDENGVPVDVGEIKDGSPRKSLLVKLDRDKVIQEFIQEIELKSPDKQRLFQNVISRAIPLIQTQIDYYHQGQAFSHPQLERIMRMLSFAFQNSPKAIKYFPILLSFNDEILSGNSLMGSRNPGNKWCDAKEEVKKTGIYLKVVQFFVNQMPSYRAVISSFWGFDPSKGDIPDLLEKNRLNEFFNAVRQRLNEPEFNFYVQLLQESSEDLLVFTRLSKGVINVKIPNLFDWKKKDEVETDRRIGVCSQGIFLSSLASLFSVEEIDYTQDLTIKFGVPTKSGIVEKEGTVHLRQYI